MTSNQNPNSLSDQEISTYISTIRQSIIDKTYNPITFSESDIRRITNKTIETFQKETTLISISSPINVVGDIHGQLFDLLKIFECIGDPSFEKYLFLGDYVDRGKYSLECLMLLFLYKVKYPSKFFLLRGNHEDSCINKIYGFYDECKRKISIKAWKHICDVYVFMPITAVINSKILCMHGGLGPEFDRLSLLSDIKLPFQIPDSGLICDILWADPSEDIPKNENFGISERGISVTFSSSFTRQFLINNRLDLIIRAHQVVEDGYEFFADQRLITVFSCPNYTGEFDNKGCVVYVDDRLVCSLIQFKANVGFKSIKKR